ncbi:NAD(P)-dependent oxidoreductase [Cryptosporangium arvum]|uniref:NAD(P)-dependent oxidoreductase n=1 Tax=Cryptosporangium arvum TaxID=80871 RepID=UPI0004B01148|nr:NAD(P)H-binding protein [Cryptosporangium arvum]
MSRIVVIGGTGYAGSAIVAEAAGRGHEVTAFSRSAPTEPVPGVTYVQGDATDEAALAAVVRGADVVVAALAPRGPLAGTFRAVTGTAARLADAEGATLYVVGGFSSLRPAPGAPRFVEDLTHVPAELHTEVLAGAGLVVEDLPATPETLNWVFVSPARMFGSFAPGERRGAYRVGDEVSVAPSDGGAISGADYALGFVDLIEKGAHHRAHVNLAH